MPPPPTYFVPKSATDSDVAKGLVTNYGEGVGGYKTGGWGGGGACEGGGGGERSLSHAEGGTQNVFGSFLRSTLKF